MDLKESAILGDRIGRHWYYQAKSAAVARMLDGRRAREVLDIGAGSGFFSRYLLESGVADAATCVDPGYERDHDEATPAGPMRFRRELSSSGADLVLLMDVLEHVDDDEGLLRQYVAMVAPGTRFLITVPAFQMLWSGHDVFLDHRRRYTLPQIEGVAKAAGLRIERGCYFFGLLFPLAAAARLATRSQAPRSDLGRTGPVLNRAFSWICRAELPFFRHNRLAGLSAVCVASKA